MSPNPAEMTAAEVRQYREAVAALVAAMLQRLRGYPLPDEAPPITSQPSHE